MGGQVVTLEYDWALINLCIDNLIPLRNGWNNTRFLCIKVDLVYYLAAGGCCFLQTVKDVHMPAATRVSNSCIKKDPVTSDLLRHNMFIKNYEIKSGNGEKSQRKKFFALITPVQLLMKANI